jgi:hypothetical protein
MKAGDTFLVPDAFGKHLNVVLAVLEDGSAITCHLTHLDRHSDTTCVIEANEHPFVDRRTVVRYSAAQICCEGQQLDALERCIEKKFDPVSPDLLKRIIQGALNSPQTPDKVKNALK